MTTISWEIEWMDVSTQPIAGETEVVLTAGWRCIGTDNSTPPNTTSSYGSCTFPQPTTGGQFTPYQQLTQDQVLGWCYANGVNQSQVETFVKNELSALTSPPVTQPPLPWAASSTDSKVAA